MNRVGSVILVLGPMYAGKTSELLRQIRRVGAHSKSKALVIKHEIDTRYDPLNVCTHNQDKERCVPLRSLTDVFALPDYAEATHVYVEEAQFFEDLVAAVDRMVDVDGKHVVVFGLNGDANRKLFGDIYKLLPKVDDIVHLKGICPYCHEQRDAIFSMRIHPDPENPQIEIGSDKTYVSVCRKHYLEMMTAAGPSST